MNGKQKTLALISLVGCLAVVYLMMRARDGREPEAAPPPAPPQTLGAGAASSPPAPPPAGPSAVGPRLDPAVLERAKAATVFVQVRSVSYLDGEVGEEGSGSGFFVSPDGRVATSWHVISATRAIGSMGIPFKPGRIQVIIRSGRRDQKVLPARLLAADPASDMAVLQVEAAGCPFLQLGRAESLVETTPLWVLGFPLGKVFSVLQRGPELSVNGGTVSSLRHDDIGNLRNIQFDAVVIKGNSGGPVITPEGRAVGVANIALGSSRMNFAVPVERLTELMEHCPAGRGVGESCALSVRSRPAGATVYVDSRRMGVTPLDCRAAGGWRRVVISAPGRRSWSRMMGVYDGLKVEAELEPHGELRLDARELQVESAPGGTAMTAGREMFSENFADPRAADSWRQDTGGNTDQRTWYVEKGVLHQFSDDEMLHAVFADRGGETLADYSFSARVRIEENEKDGRAGLIFRSTKDGFALYRLHRETGRVQLAYHMNNPFGWRVLDERKLPFPVKGGNWYRMEVQALGDQIVCLLEGKVVLQATVQQPLSGRVGFYSVDSRAAFDDARVAAVSAPKRDPGRAVTLRGFWFTDRFETDCGYWQAFKSGQPAPPWTMVPSGLMQLDAGASSSTCLLTRYDATNIVLSSMVSCSQGTVGLVFRRRGGRYYLLAVNPAKNSARLLLVDGAETKQIGAAAEPAAVERAIGGLRRSAGAREAAGGALRHLLSLFVSAQGSRIRAGVNGQMLLDAEDETLTSGNVGFYANRARAVFHSLDAASPSPGP